MLITIKTTFPKAIFFGFTGTPIQDENQKKKNTTTTVFGNELHRYSIADGIRDKNVLGFDPYKVLTFKDKDVRKVVALEKAKAQTEEEAISDPIKSKVYYKYMDAGQVGMVGHFDSKGDYIKGIEDYIPNIQYQTEEHTTTVVKDILENWVTLSHNSKFHAIFATSSIPEAINYYRMIKKMKPEMKVTALFDPNIDNGGGVAFKEAGLVEIIEDYNERYGQDFTIPTFAKMKKDIAARLAHKKPYERIANEPEKQIDLLIVVDQIQSRQFDEVANQSTGTKMPRADWNLVSKTEFFIPKTIDEQAAIGTYFEQLDNLITLHQRESTYFTGGFYAE